MARPLRDTTPNKIHLLTCRSRLSELLFVPQAEINNCIGGVIAKYSEKYEISLYGICVLGNHYHILASSPRSNLYLFAENINREIAKRVNRLVGRQGSLWGRRYDDQIVIEEHDALEGLLYILCNPIKHGLVSHPRLWPGLSTYWQTVEGRRKAYSFINYTKYNRALHKAKLTGEFVRRSDFETAHELKITPIPLFTGRGLKECQNDLAKQIDKRARKLVDARRKEGLSILGRKKVLCQPQKGVFPKRSSRSPRPACYSKSLKAISLFAKQEKCRREAYRESSRRFRLGELTVEFPFSCLYPPRHHVPRIESFAPT